MNFENLYRNPADELQKRKKKKEKSWAAVEMNS